MDLSRLVDLYFNAEVAARYLPDLAWGLWITILLAACVIVTGLAAGLLLALLRLVSHKWIVEIIRLWVDCFRAIPPLAVILLLYFGLPGVGITLSAFWVMWLTLSCILCAFAEEIYWAGLSATPKGQWEAARSTGLGFGQTLRLVILPQAIKMCVPPLTNRTIAITKNTALGTAIGLPEMLNEAQVAQSFSGNATPLIIAALGYLLIFMPVMAFASQLEKRMRWGNRNG